MRSARHLTEAPNNGVRSLLRVSAPSLRKGLVPINGAVDFHRRPSRWKYPCRLLETNHGLALPSSEARLRRSGVLPVRIPVTQPIPVSFPSTNRSNGLT
jgi:hypothetical protein